MIKLDRGETPAIFHSELMQKSQGEARTFFGQPARQRAQQRFDFQRQASRIYPAIRRELAARFPAKCAYCETPLEKPEIESFRPKQRATNLDGTVQDDHYWWLTFEWSNYLPACSQCNALKGSRFPVKGRRAAAGTVGTELAKERRLLLDPCEDEPSNVLLFLDNGHVTSEDERGQVTIDVLGLNRASLVSARHRDLQGLMPLISTPPSPRDAGRIVETLTAMTADASPYAAMRRQYVRAWAMEVAPTSARLARLTRDLQAYPTALSTGLKASRSTMKQALAGLTERTQHAESYSVLADNVSDDYYRQARFIERFELENIRACKYLELRTSLGWGGAGKWLIMLGENGSGKSSALQALACALSGQTSVEALGIRATDMLRHGCAKGEVRVHMTGMSRPIVMKLARQGNRITIDPPEPKVMVLGYGATRLLTEDATGPVHASRINIANLFDPFARLSNGQPWLYEADKAEFDRFARTLSALLPRSDGARFSRRGNQIYVEAPGVRDTLVALSSGYQAVLALALDIMSVMRLSWEDMQSAEGIVLIDEVDAHLHPRWKMRIVQRLREVFPRLQFIATSHEPMTLRGLDRDEVAILKRSLDGAVTAITADTADLPSPKNMRVEQLLTSEFFGLHSAEDLEVDMLFEEYYRLLAQRKRTAEEEQRLVELREQLESSRQMGLTEREKLVFKAADSYIAERKAAREALPDQVRAGANARLQRIWAKLEDEHGNTRGTDDDATEAAT